MLEKVASYIFDDSVDYGTVHVMASYPNRAAYEARQVGFYFFHDHNGDVLLADESYHEMPSWQDVYEFYWLPTVAESSQVHRDLRFIDTN